MRNRISAIIIDPDWRKHNYEDIKTTKENDYAEEFFDLKVLEHSRDILHEIYNFNGVDCIITIGDLNCFKELSYLSFNYRKKWCHYDSFNPVVISNAIVNTLTYNLTRTDAPTSISVFTCTYKTGERKLMRLYKSLTKQVYREWNWFILDDSPDNDTIELINSLKDPRITVIKNITKHGNIGFNKHTIAMMCDGDILVEVDHDDELTPDCFLCIKDAFDKYPDADFAYSLCIEFSGNVPIIYGKGWGWGEGFESSEYINGKRLTFSSSPDVNPYTIRTIFAQPNHIRCWKKDFYHKIGGHNTELSVLDDMEILIRTFIKGKMIKIDKVLYYQYEESGERGSKENNNTQSSRFAEIQRTVWYIKNHYDLDIHNRILELGFKDDPWDEEMQTSILWKNHTPGQEIMNYTYKP
jgi:glycosyltransferase involved in cell wall biosynthesis